MADSKGSERPPSIEMKDPIFPEKPRATACGPTEEQTTPGENSIEMPPGGKPRSNTLRREADLSSLLNPGEKAELTALVTKVTESMQTHLTQLFDPIRDDGTVQPSRVTSWSKLPYYLKDLSLSNPLNEIQRANLKENVKPPRSKKPGRARDKPDAALGAADGPRQDEKDVAPRLQELKKEALLHFRKWQVAVNRRIGEISVKKAPDALPAQPVSGPRRRPSANKRNKPVGPQTPISPVPILEPDPVLMQIYPPTPTAAAFWPVEKRCLVMHALLLLLVSLEHYGAYTRVLLLNLVSSLRLPLRVLTEDEVRVGGALARIAKNIPSDLLTPKKEDGKPSRRWKAGMASAVVAGTAGASAAVLEAARIGSVFGMPGIPGTAAAGLLGAMTESGLAVAALFGIYGARNGCKMMEHYLKNVGDLAFVPLRGSIGRDSEIGKIASESRRLRVVLGISGWLMNKGGAANPWHCLGDHGEVYAVQWELDALTKLGKSFDTLVRSAAWSMAKQEIIARTIFSNLADGRWPEGLLKISKIIDNNWNNGMVRADKLGGALADIIMSKAQGERGVSLIGYSLGARAVYACLMTLAEKRAFGLIENVVMMGAPAPSEPLAWCTMKSVVSGRLVNVYSENDYILGFLYRTSSVEFGLAGLRRVTGVDGIENVDVTAEVSIHPRYQFLVGSILRHIGWEDLNREHIARDEAEMSFWEDRNRKHEERRNAMELGKIEANRDNDQGIIRTRMRKKGKK